jgi:hypothetical protein
MLRIDKQETLPEVPGITIWGDDKSSSTFYVLPDVPSFRMQDNGTPVFKMVKYRQPIDTNRPDGQKGGGYIFFDASLAVPNDKLQAAKKVLQERVNKQHTAAKRPGTPPEVKFGSITFARGKVGLILEQDGKLIEKVRGAGKPSLYGDNIATFAVELSQLGATVFEQAMQGQGASSVSVVYELHFWSKLPPLTARVWFNANKFYSFYQNVDIEWKFWGEDSYRETLREQFSESESAGTEVNTEFVLPDPEADKKLKDKIKDWAQRTLEDLVEQKMKEAIPGVPEDKRKIPEGIENLTRDLSVYKIQSFERTYKEDSAVEWNLNPQGYLPALTSLKDRQGKPLQWKDYSVYVDPDDKFFRQLNVSVTTNADFQRLPLHSIVVNIEYPKGGNDKAIGGGRLTSTNPGCKFATYVENDNRKYKYWYEVFYKGASKTYKSQVVETQQENLEIAVDDAGILSLDLLAGDIDWDQVRAAQVTVKYEDKDKGVAPIQQQFMLDDNQREQRFQKLIFAPQQKPFQCQIKYLMKNGKEFLGQWVNQWSSPFVVNDVWNATMTVGVRASGDLVNQIETIFIDLTYTDPANKYTQSKSVALSELEPFVDWSFPVIQETGGKIVYSGTIKYKDGTEEEIKQTESTKNTILVGPKVLGFLEVEVLPDLIDFDLVKLAKVSLQYEDKANDLVVKKDVVFRPGSTDAFIWKVQLKDKKKTDYQYQYAFFMVDGSTKKVGPETTNEQTLLPQLPA